MFASGQGQTFFQVELVFIGLQKGVRVLWRAVTVELAIRRWEAIQFFLTFLI